MAPLLLGAACLLIFVRLFPLAWRQLFSSRVKVITVIDGDTVLVLTRRGRKRKVRLYGLDAPETGQRGAPAAKARLETLVLGEWVVAYWRGRDRYRRYVATLKNEGVDPAVVLVREGLARPLDGTGFARHGLWARMTMRGVWRPGFGTPTQSLRRRSRLIGWLMWKRDTARRKRSRRRR